MEHLKVLDLFACTGKLDRLAGHGTHAQRRTAAGITVELGEDNAGNAERLVKRGGHVDRVLTRHRVHHQQDLRRLAGGADLFKFRHQLLVNVQTTGGIENHVIVAVILRVGNGRLGDLHGIFGAHLKDGNHRLLADDL